MPESVVFRDGDGPTCAMCSQIHGDADGDLIHQLLGEKDYRRRVVDLNDDYVIIPSLGGLGSRHLLLCPTRHERRIVDGAAARPEPFAEALAAIQRLAAIGTCDEQFIVFEHGAEKTGPSIPCTVEHAHLHVIGTGSESEVQPPPLGWTVMSVGIEALSVRIDEGEYLLWMLDRDSSLVLQRPGGLELPSQILRRAIASQLGAPEKWNWRLDPEVERTAATFDWITSQLVRPGPNAALGENGR